MNTKWIFFLIVSCLCFVLPPSIGSATVKCCQLITGITSCSSYNGNGNLSKAHEGLRNNQTDMGTPEEWVDNAPDNHNRRELSRFRMLFIESINKYRIIYGKLPASIAEFYDSDACFVLPKEMETGKQFQQRDVLDVNHPEYIKYSYVDSDTATLSVILSTNDGGHFIYTYPYTRERFWSALPFDNNSDEYKQLSKTSPPKTSKKAQVMLDHFTSLVYWAMADYFDAHNAFPDSFDTLFAEKWGVFRHEPWRNFVFEDPAKKLPNKTFEFDKNQNVLYVKSEWGKTVDEYAVKLPANYIQEPDRPLKMDEITDMKSLNLEFFADAETLKNL